MNNKNISRSNLFLIELIIIIVFFIFASSIILRVFVKANELSVNTVALDGAVITTQSNAEFYKTMSYSQLSNTTSIYYYDKNWQKTTFENAYYLITMEIILEDKQHGIMANFNQKVNFIDKKNDDLIFNLETKKYYKK